MPNTTNNSKWKKLSKQILIKQNHINHVFYIIYLHEVVGQKSLELLQGYKQFYFETVEKYMFSLVLIKAQLYDDFAQLLVRTSI
jgi:hypothetical protein